MNILSFLRNLKNAVFNEEGTANTIPINGKVMSSIFKIFLMASSNSRSNETSGKCSFIFKFNFNRFSNRILDQYSKVRLGLSFISF